MELEDLPRTFTILGGEVNSSSEPRTLNGDSLRPLHQDEGDLADCLIEDMASTKPEELRLHACVAMEINLRGGDEGLELDGFGDAVLINAYVMRGVMRCLRDMLAAAGARDPRRRRGLADPLGLEERACSALALLTRPAPVLHWPAEAPGAGPGPPPRYRQPALRIARQALKECVFYGLGSLVADTVRRCTEQAGRGGEAGEPARLDVRSGWLAVGALLSMLEGERVLCQAARAERDRLEAAGEECRLGAAASRCNRGLLSGTGIVVLGGVGIVGALDKAGAAEALVGYLELILGNMGGFLRELDPVAVPMAAEGRHDAVKALALLAGASWEQGEAVLRAGALPALLRALRDAAPLPTPAPAPAAGGQVAAAAAWGPREDLPALRALQALSRHHRSFLWAMVNCDGYRQLRGSCARLRSGPQWPPELVEEWRRLEEDVMQYYTSCIVRMVLEADRSMWDGWVGDEAPCTPLQDTPFEDHELADAEPVED